MSRPFTVTHSIITPVGNASGVGMHRSPKRATELAQIASENALNNLAQKYQACLSIGGEGFHVKQGARYAGHRWDL